jgi:hypothetical protein
MGDDLSKQGRQDSSKVNLEEDWERRYWARTFYVTEEELREAVSIVGPQVDDLRKHFRAPAK